MEITSDETRFNITDRLVKAGFKITGKHGQIFISADIMSSFCGVHVHMNNFSKSTGPRDMLVFFFKDTLTIEDEKVYADLFVHLFPQSHYKCCTPKQSVKISTLYNTFLSLDYCRDFSVILHICTEPLVNFLV